MKIEIKARPESIPKVMLGVQIEKNIQERLKKIAESKNTSVTNVVTAILSAGIIMIENENSIS